MILTHLQLLFLHEMNLSRNYVNFSALKYIPLIILFMALFNSCKQKAGEPSYLKVENFIVTTNTLTQGTSVQSISEAYVYIDDQIAGVYHLPAIVPLNISGIHKVKIGVAVIENAIASNMRYAYTYLNAFDTVIDFKVNGTATVKPITSYRTTVKFAMIEDFENPLPLIAKTSYNTIDTLLRDSLPQDNLEPGHCAFFNIDGYKVMEYATRNSYTLPSSTESETFVEINYKSELPLAIGLYIEEPTKIIKTGVVTLNQKSEWSKAYINLTTVVSAKPPGTTFRLFISSYNADGTVKKVFVDNIKLIHFE